MTAIRWRWSRRDLLFMIETLMPERDDKEHVADIVQDDEPFVEAMLDDDRLFQRLMAEEEVLLKVSPLLFFTVLLRRARRDLERETYTVEVRHLQKVIIFDTDQAVELLEREPVRDYLAAMLTSFTRIESVTVPVRVRKGIWRKIRINDFDVNSLMRHSQTLDEDLRFQAYRRIADVCLFLAGMFPDYIETRYRYPLSGQTRPRMRSEVIRDLDDYEDYGQAFYRLAAEHEMAKVQKLDEVLATLSENFVVAEKPLAFLSDRYLQFRKHGLFGV